MLQVGPTKYFEIEEWDSRHPLAAPYPREWAVDRWLPLARTLDVIREALGEPLTVTPNGGYRTPSMNQAIGGAKRSQHCEGYAADVTAAKASAKKVHALVLRLWKEGKLPLLGGLGLYGSFVHVDIRPKDGNVLARWDRSKPTDGVA